MHLLSLKDVAERVSFSKSTLWRFRQRYADYPQPIIIAGRPRWVAEEIDAWFMSRREGPVR